MIKGHVKYKAERCHIDKGCL